MSFHLYLLLFKLQNNMLERDKEGKGKTFKYLDKMLLETKKSSKSMVPLINQREEDSIYERKIDIIASKLTFKLNQSNLSKTNTIKVNSMEENHSNKIDQIKKKYVKINKESQENQLLLSKEANQLILREKHKSDSASQKFFSNLSSLELFTKAIANIKYKCEGQSLKKRQFRFYSSLKEKVNNRTNHKQEINFSHKRKSTYHSSFKEDHSLLLSFRKNLEEEEGYITLKYSQESNQRKGRMMNQSKYQPFDLETVQPQSNVKKAKFAKDQVASCDYQDRKEDFEDFVKGELSTDIQQVKNRLNYSQHSVTKALCSFQSILDKVIQEIAEEKVESNEQWTQIVTSSNIFINEIKSILEEEKYQFKNTWSDLDEQMITLEQSLRQKFQIQKCERKKQQKIIISMMNGMTEALQ